MAGAERRREGFVEELSPSILAEGSSATGGAEREVSGRGRRGERGKRTGLVEVFEIVGFTLGELRDRRG